MKNREGGRNGNDFVLKGANLRGDSCCKLLVIKKDEIGTIF